MLLWNLGVCQVLVLVAAPPLAAQATGTGKWEIEFRGGRTASTNPISGAVTLPGPGEVFITGPSTLIPPPSSRRESSWYFGDGTVLFNQAVTALGQLPDLMTTLDPVLARPIGEWHNGGTLGVSVTRAFSPRISAEFSVDYNLARLQMTDANRDAVEATRASFIPAFTGMIRFNRNRVVQSITSTAALEGGGGRQIVTSGAVVVNLRSTGRVIPYVSGGAGLISITGTTPSVALQGNYQFLTAPGNPVDETDNVTVKDARDTHTLAGIVGGGVKYYVSPRWGIRIAARTSVFRNTANTTLDTAPIVTLGLQPAGGGALGGDPSIQFSNTSSPVTVGGVTGVMASTLTGPPITGHRTFSGSGVVNETSVTVGLLWRF